MPEVDGTTENPAPKVPRFPCVCCGHLVFEQRVGSFEICPVCFWEDDLVQTRWPDFEGGPNQLSLIECQRNYRALGAVQTRVLKYVRPAADDEPIEDGWFPLGPADLVHFEPVAEDLEPWPEEMTRLYWWRPTFWRARPPR
ncbi:CPCC family cysteine-rich protein [Actinospica robiniae]|uniref:CPCC family cysteine-rich protein n=1 Tax=Actinospica robiniae TaxID=304901 RepID=UPI000421A11F|nr:CPCC family cysteine-rich protein [Actinospica robiniae]